MNDNIDKMIEDSLNNSSEETTYYFNNDLELCTLDNNEINEKDYDVNQDGNKNFIGKIFFIMRKIKIPMIICFVFIFIKLMKTYFLFFIENHPVIIWLSPIFIISFYSICMSIYEPLKPIFKRKRCNTPVVCEIVKTSLIKVSNHDGSPVDIWSIIFKYYYNGTLYHNSKSLPISDSKPQEYSRFKILINPYQPSEYCNENDYIEFSIKSYILNILFNFIPIAIVLGLILFFIIR